MGVLTLLTDFGYRDHYVAALKARLLHLAPTLPVLDLTHGVEPYNIAHAVHVLRAVFRDFPLGTTHLITVSDYGASAAGAVATPAWHAAEHEGHFFVAADNGLLPLLCDGVPAQLVRLEAPALAAPASPTLAAGNLQPVSLNPTRDILAPAAVRLALGQPLSSLGTAVTDLYLLTNRQLRLQDNRITGHVVHVDHYGNLITNISREAVEVVGRSRPATVHFGREVVRELRPHFAAAPPGEIVCTFNPQGCLSIAINQGHASELLGLYFDSQVDVRFAE
ncbi:SAM-dependent chlorinase/fluorinase [Hymenobacter sp. BRD128]|uniref:SAM hydrolase/SAM-dependent halogenase family protein n=1 Tax=Hymenobacter sp. BRD128 TaxID=2675878 RepID=UPI001565D8A9|nr:SAM-dependent chlorinase/fluorinase [Hymenobacter sp. BRD128]QKG55283.1 SAM-dependent chlorinase/fluorinase [Hymenobacter sp. BRD128]